jgi:CheY-like chemotaxis protein
VQLNITTADDTCTVFIDASQLEQVIMNLSINARDAMPDGGVLWIATSCTASTVSLTVIDTGVGVDPNVRDSMFKPFVTTKDPGKGTGLGLATVMSIVHAAGGNVGVTSTHGQGTAFEITFPLCDTAPAMAREASEPAEPRAGLHVLLVEDDAALCRAVATILQDSKCVVTSVPSGDDALRELQRSAFEMVITDALMPGISGPALAAQLSVTHPDLPVVLMSGFVPASAEHQPGVAALLRKPFTRQQLLSVVHRVSDGPSRTTAIESVA